MNANMKCATCGKTARTKLLLNGCTLPSAIVKVFCPSGHGPMIRIVAIPKNRKMKGRPHVEHPAVRVRRRKARAVEP